MTSAGRRTVRLTVAQALVRFLAAQYSERDGVEQRLVPGMFGIFGHGNVAGVGQALLQAQVQAEEAGGGQSVTQRPVTDPADGELPYYMARNEQGAVNAAAAFAKTTDRLQALAVTASIGPGSTNMVTGAALATTNRLPVLLLPSDIFATRYPDPVLQQLEDPRCLDISVNDAFKPVSRFWDRINRPEQLIPSALAAMRVLADPAETGAVTICLPQDVQAEAYDWPEEFFARRVWHVARPVPEPAALERALAAIRAAKKPLVVAGGGVIYSGASEVLREFASATGIPVADTQAGKGAINWDHPLAVGGVGSTGNMAANTLAREADLVIGVGTRYSDFTTASHTIFANPDVRFVNVNVLAFDAAKHSATMVVADAREALTALQAGLAGWRTDEAYQSRAAELDADWQRVVDECYHRDQTPLPAQTEVFGALNELMGDTDVVINAAGSMPGDLQCLWRAKTPQQYHLEYAFSCMGYEIPAAMGVRMAKGEEGQVVAIVGDGTYQMLPMEIATIVAERLKVIFVLLQNHGYASIGALSESRGSQRFGTKYRMRNAATGRLDGEEVPFDLAANAASWGATVLRCNGIEEFRENYAKAAAADGPTVLYIETDLYGPNPPGSAWWDVPVSQVSELESTQLASKEYEEEKAAQRHYL
ncbi:3D-(3,5/4)-trihydroxycyclohexane-1,2-dione acylhydrolase (decyclizing) [Kineosphaera limosa]|uniref:3D-(3,5/4)-trihydroxycyclohexane-1,2-dione hydrolase n=1 Tax=Kineosphaera limosa NBRC 100340 TaxID=1184609 RepID=K6VEM7_9MICO|nr:3D-(3,5/4)-trihydroxycyclohexane-1,2-dione acylhydrolase (decyclizing) [Kineosphaera limosa]NYE01055.1 3D-(3,5/4)-trihydroxycyclohexane-1,2-dione acylhydrolase (decyclizing) [Kineosphaera limosa]GAB94653.1 3D-(3,5/4)-trihydroxycyclohexane-1,2-dione hydrolase [Kineosphaera limosa NBRC 100340]